MRVLVTGGTGFAGKALAVRLLELGHDVVVLDVKEGVRTDELRERGARVVLGSVADPAEVRRSVDGAQAVFHLAAAFREVGVAPDHYRRVNVEGTENVLQESLRAGVSRFVYCSTVGVHGHVEAPPASEDAPIRPADYYQQTKYDGELATLRAVDRGLDAVILRPAAIYGPGDPERFFLIYRRAARGTFPIFGSGRTLYHPLFIDHLTDAFVLALQPRVGTGQAYLIGDEGFVAVMETSEKTKRSADRARIVVAMAVPTLVTGLVALPLAYTGQRGDGWPVPVVVLLFVAAPVAAWVHNWLRPSASSLGRALLVGLSQLPLVIAMMHLLLWLEVRASNLRAQAIYQTHGFRRVGDRKRYYPADHGQREDAVVMSLGL